jgi:ketopantoate hydroxymethyltransferase
VYAPHLFTEDILDMNRGRVPQHTKQYVNLRVEYDRLQGLMTQAFTEFSQDVDGGGYFKTNHLVEVKEDEFSKFLAGL